MDQRTAESLVEHVPRMYRVALRLVGEPEEAQDVVQEACVKAVKKLPSFDGRSLLSTWLHSITLNCARDRLRQLRRAARNRMDLDADLQGVLTVLESSPEDRAEQRELYQIASRLVDRLPGECRSAFVLTQLDGYSYTETAAIQNEPRGTIASRVHRAKRILLEAMNSLTEGRTDA